jgi:D-lactate dehydrogenase
MAFVTGSARVALNIVHFIHMALGSKIMKGISSAVRKASFDTIPAWNRYMPKGSHPLKHENPQGENPLKVVYFPSCINRSMGVSGEYRNEKQLSEVLTGLLKKAGYDVIVPERLNSLCCGMAFSSKGYVETGKKKSDELEAALIKASGNGKYPVLCDMSPCLYTMKENIHSVKLYEPVEFILKFLVRNLNIKPLHETVSVFPVCSLKKMQLEGSLLELARMCADNVVMPETNCCGFAGDRGFTCPELNRHGLRDLKKQIPENVKQGYSNSRTCEIGLSLHSGVSFRSIVYLVDMVSTSKPADAFLKMKL